MPTKRIKETQTTTIKSCSFFIKFVYNDKGTDFDCGHGLQICAIGSATSVGKLAVLLEKTQ